MLLEPFLRGSPASCRQRWMWHWPLWILGHAWPGQGVQALPGPGPSASACSKFWGSGHTRSSGGAAVPFGCTQAARAPRACLAAALGQQLLTVQATQPRRLTGGAAVAFGCRGFRALPGPGPLLDLPGVLRCRCTWLPLQMGAGQKWPLHCACRCKMHACKQTAWVGSNLGRAHSKLLLQEALHRHPWRTARALCGHRPIEAARSLRLELCRGQGAARGVSASTASTLGCHDPRMPPL